MISPARCAAPLSSAPLAFALLAGLAYATFFALALTPSVQAAGDVGIAVARTNSSTLNDLVRRIPIESLQQQRDLSVLSAVQEQIILHEQWMCGQGLPVAQQQAFAASYSAILSAIIDERVRRSDGRALLDRQRGLLEQAYWWACLAKPDPAFGENLNESLEILQHVLADRTLPPSERSYAARTPVINGQLLWVEELLIWGGRCRFISYGELGKIGSLARRLEQFEGYYKKDGVLTDRERENLHERLIEIHRETIESFRS